MDKVVRDRERRRRRSQQSGLHALIDQGMDSVKGQVRGEGARAEGRGEQMQDMGGSSLEGSAVGRSHRSQASMHRLTTAWTVSRGRQGKGADRAGTW